jgi:hypothetical protein
MECFSKVFGKEHIKALTADREFIGSIWLDWLKEHNIPYVIRIKEDGQMIANSRGKMVKVSALFHILGSNHSISLNNRKLGRDNRHYKIYALRNKRLELMVLIHSGKFDNPAEIYAHRWDIETMFKAFKSSGFDSEATHIVDEERINTLMQVMAIAFCIAYSVGEIIAKEQPPLIKKHGYKQHSTFRSGLNHIVRIFHNIHYHAKKWRTLLKLIFGTVIAIS